MLQMIFSPPGGGKTSEIYNDIKRRSESGQSDMILFVPEQISFETERSMLHLLSAKGKECIDVLSFSRFADRFFAKYGGRNKKCIDNMGRTAIMQLSLRRLYGSLPLFSKQVRSASFCERLVFFNSQMKRFDVSADALLSAAQRESGTLSQKLNEISLIMSEYERLLNVEYYDPLDDLSKIAKSADLAEYFAEKTVFFDSFNGFTAQQMLLVEKIIAFADNVIISLCLDKNAPAGDMSVYSGMRQTAEKLRRFARQNGVKIAPDITPTDICRYNNGELKFMSENAFAADGGHYDGECGNIHITRLRNIYEECDYLAAVVRRLTREQGIRYREIAVIARDTEKYSGIIERAFARCNIPCFIDAKKGADATALVRFVTNALAAAKNYNPENIMAMLKTGISFADDEDVMLLDNYISVWGCTGNDLQKPLCGSIKDTASAPDEAEQALLDRINALRERIILEISKLHRAAEHGGARNISEAVYKFITDMGAARQLDRFCAELSDKGMNTEADVQRKAYELVIALLDQLVISLENYDVDYKTYCDLFSAAIASADIGKLPQGLDEVSVGSAERMRPRLPKVTFIIGANEGEFPSVFSGDGLFSDSELVMLKSDGIELACYDEQRAADEKFLAFSAMCSPSEQLFVSCYSSDSQSGAKQPSQIVAELQKMFDITVQSYDDVPIESVSAALGALALARKRNDEQYAVLSEYFRRCPNDEYERISEAGGRIKTELACDTAVRLFGNDIHLSASKIDNFYHCSYGYFCRYGLKISPNKKAAVDPLMRGTLTHLVLCRFIEHYSPQDYRALDNDELNTRIKDIIFDAAGVFLSSIQSDGIQLYKIESLCKTMKKMLDMVYDELDQTDYEFKLAELSFGSQDGDDYAEQEIALPGGGRALISGKIDRVDSYTRGGEQYIRIIDYKSGGKDFRLADVLYGQNLQMLLYLSAYKRAVKQKDNADIIPAGVLYMPVRDGKPQKDSREIPDEQTLLSLRRKQMKMNGFLLNDTASLTAMEPGLTGEYAGISEKDGVIVCDSVYTAEQYETLAKYMDKLTVNMCELLHDGKIEISPLDGDSAACEYCDYKDICRIGDTPVKKIPNISDNEAFYAMEEEAAKNE